MKHRIDWVVIHKMIRNFLEKEIAELKVKRKAKCLITSSKEIAGHVGVSVKTVRSHLLEMTKEADPKVVVVKLDHADVVVKLRR